MSAIDKSVKDAHPQPLTERFLDTKCCRQGRLHYSRSDIYPAIPFYALQRQACQYTKIVRPILTEIWRWVTPGCFCPRTKHDVCAFSHVSTTPFANEIYPFFQMLQRSTYLLLLSKLQRAEIRQIIVSSRRSFVEVSTHTLKVTLNSRRMITSS